MATPHSSLWPQHHPEEGDEDTLTRSNGYANLSDVRVMRGGIDSFSYSTSGSFDDPSSLLDRHPYRPPVNDPGNTLVENDHENDYDEVPVDYDSFDSFSDYEETDEELTHQVPIVGQSRRVRAETRLDIIGSLCLQGVMQGLVPAVEGLKRQGSVRKSSRTEILPTSIMMTANLEGQQSELDELSVMVTRMEIVPESPYNANAGTERAKQSSTAPQGQILQVHKGSMSARPVSQFVSVNHVEVRPTSVRYINNIARAQPLPPLNESLPANERKRYKVVENLLESEAGFLTSLNIAVELYKKPLLQGSVNTELTHEEVKSLFGPIASILEHHELFFAALSEQTKEWAPSKQIGDVFLASFNRNEVAKHYSRYVNNFTLAMSILEKSIKKKNKFVEFLKKQMNFSGCMLSLQALLLKPIQRFPQYLLFLHDLLKYTPASHPDSVVLEMAEAHIEGIANYLNEAKRKSEQLTIIKYLNSKIDKLPVKLMDKNHALHRQDVIQWAVHKNNKWIYKERELLLFDHLLVCCSVKMKPNDVRKSLLIEADQVISGEGTPHLIYKWACPISQVEIIDPDYMKETSPLVIGETDAANAEMKKKYKELKDEMSALNQDFEILYKIGGLMASLSKQYESVNVENIQNSCRILQRKLENSQELIRSCCEPCRVDISVTNSDGARYHQILLFSSKNVRQDWIRTFQLAKLRQSPNNTQTWVANEVDNDDIDGGLEEEEEGDANSKIVQDTAASSSSSTNSESLPLLVDSMRLSHHNEISTVECAVSVGNSRVWFATGNANGAFISIIRCFMPSPILIETFPVPTHKILCMKAIPTTYSGTADASTLTIWAGSQCGKLLLFDASSNKCLQTVQLRDSVICIEKYKNRAFVGLASGHVNVYTRVKGNQWNIVQYNHQIPVSPHTIQCFCAVDNKLWMGVQKSCVILNMETLHLESSIKVSNDDGVFVKRLEKAGAGVWVVLNKGAILYLFHKDTRKPIQEINIKGSLSNIISCTNVEDKFGSLGTLHITSILAKAGYLWVGLSTGAILIYRIPPLNGLPLLNSRPFLAGDGHNGTVRVLVAVQTKMDNSLARFDQFVLDEKERMIGSFMEKTPRINESDDKGVDSVPAVSTPIKKTPPDEIDDSALPRVEQVIKKLEYGKQLLQAADSPRPIPKPRTKKLKKKASAGDVLHRDTKKKDGVPGDIIRVQTSPARPQDLSITDSPHIDKSPVTETTSSITGPVKVTVTSEGSKVPNEGEPYEVPVAKPQADYETPIDTNTIKRVAAEDQPDTPVYSEVPTLETPNEEEEPTDLNRTASDAGLITPSRYQGNPILSGDQIYEHIRSATITMAIPGREALPTTLCSTFVFTGGSGINNFRPSNQPSLLQQLQASNPVTESPFVMIYQVP